MEAGRHVSRSRRGSPHLCGRGSRPGTRPAHDRPVHASGPHRSTPGEAPGSRSRAVGRSKRPVWAIRSIGSDVSSKAVRLFGARACVPGLGQTRPASLSRPAYMADVSRGRRRHGGWKIRRVGGRDQTGWTGRVIPRVISRVIPCVTRGNTINTVVQITPLRSGGDDTGQPRDVPIGAVDQGRVRVRQVNGDGGVHRTGRRVPTTSMPRC